MSTTPIEETLTVPLDGKKSQQEDLLAQVKVLLEEIRVPKGNMQSYSGTWMRDQLCWACGKMGHFRRDCQNFYRRNPRDMQLHSSQPPLRWPNTVFARALADAIQHVHKNCKDKHAVDTAITLFARCPHYLCYFSS